MNPFEVVKNMFVKGMTPEGMAKLMAKRVNNPMINDLIKKVENGEVKSTETFARNVLKEMGYDYDKEYENMRKEFNF